jgi:hypothetical protein
MRSSGIGALLCSPVMKPNTPAAISVKRTRGHEKIGGDEAMA